jgi:lysine 2,3-aminomutase
VPLDEAARRLGYDATGWRAAARAFPVRWPEGYLALAEQPEGEALRRMGAPDPAELLADPGDLADAVGEGSREVVPFVVRKHRDRAILLVTARCHFYCRFCFRRTFPAGDHRDPTRGQLEGALEYIAAEQDLREVILSGGDPLVLGDDVLADLLARLAALPHVETLRVHSRAPVHEPARVTEALAHILGSAGRPLWLVTHFNHPLEITEASRAAIDLLLRAGVPVLNQSVLLRGVNDDAEVLATLMRGLLAARVKPYYLHHPDRVPGNASFRVSIERGLAIFDELRSRAGGTALPAYVIDLPDGSGKQPVSSLVRIADARYRAPNGFDFEDIT